MSNKPINNCTICRHVAVVAIDGDLSCGIDTITELSRRYRVSRQALLRHRAAHLPNPLLKPLVERAEGAPAAKGPPDRAALLLSELEALRTQIAGFIVAAQRKGDVRGAVTAIREATRLLELLAKMQGTLVPPPTVQINMLETTEFRSVAARIIEALTDEPSAREKVSAALRFVH